MFSESTIEDLGIAKILPHIKNIKEGPSRRVLILDDDADFAEILTWSLRKALPNAKFDQVTNHFEALNCMSEKKYDFLVFDWRLQNTNCWSALTLVDRHLNMDPTVPFQWTIDKVPVVVVSGGAIQPSQLLPLDHFRYAGFVDKRQTLDSVVRDLSIRIHEHAPNPAPAERGEDGKMTRFMSSFSRQMQLC